MAPPSDPSRCARCAREAGWASIGGNLLVAVVKWYVGVTFHSQGVVADAMHTSMDTCGSLVALVFIKLAQRGPSARYPYGLGKLEDVAAAAIHLILITAGGAISVRAIHSIITGDLLSPEMPAVLVTVISIVANGLMWRFIECAGSQAKSSSLLALAQENRADMLSSVGVLVGVAGAIMGVKILDPLAALLVGVLILVGNIKGLWGMVEKLTDRALPPEVHRRIEGLAARVAHVRGVLAVKTRPLGRHGHADVDILVDPDMSVASARAIAELVAERVRLEIEEIGSVKVLTYAQRDESSTRAARLDVLLDSLTELGRSKPKRLLPVLPPR